MSLLHVWFPYHGSAIENPLKAFPGANTWVLSQLFNIFGLISNSFTLLLSFITTLHWVNFWYLFLIPTFLTWVVHGLAPTPCWSCWIKVADEKVKNYMSREPLLPNNIWADKAPCSDPSIHHFDHGNNNKCIGRSPNPQVWNLLGQKHPSGHILAAFAENWERYKDLRYLILNIIEYQM